MKLDLWILILLTFISCHNSNLKSDINNREELTEIISDAEFAKTDSNLISQYKLRLNFADSSEKMFINNLLYLIEKYQNKRLDTTVLTIGLVDNDNLNDTISSRIFLKRDTIWVLSSWIKNQDTLWTYDLKNPYAYISNFNLFQFDIRENWVTYAIGIHYAIPEIYKLKNYQNLLEISIKLGQKDLKSNGINVDIETYSKYILNYNGNLVEWGHPANRNGLHIWYEPVKSFVTYYQP